MSAPTTTTPSRRPRTASIVIAAVLGIVALLSFAVAGVSLYGEVKKDDDGFLSTDSHRFATDRSAIATEDADLGGGEGWFVDTDRFGNVRLQVRPATAKPVFVGIARSADVAAYLRGRDHTTLTELDYLPFEADYDEHPARRRPAPPAGQDFWAASASGSGPQTLTWDVRHGSWSVVVMNADGSPGVDARVRAGAELPALDEIGWSALGVGLASVLAALAALLLGRPRRPHTAAPAPATAPAGG
jgi:hypothetical protein